MDKKISSSKAIICDIEGTTTSISFVKETLFPYAIKNVEDFLNLNWDSDTVKNAINELRQQARIDADENCDGCIPILNDSAEKVALIESVVKNFEWLMSNDRKVSALKNLQGLIWEKGYKDGAVKGHVYDDVPVNFSKWTESGHKIYIYSSGSVQAQKLLFEHTIHGNLMEHITDYFDTAIGAKQESSSYEKIIEKIGLTADEIVFLTDIVKEAEAAKLAGMNTVLLNRSGNAPFTDQDKESFQLIDNLNELQFESVGLKRKIEETDSTEERPIKVSKTDDDKSLENIKVVKEEQEEASAIKEDNNAKVTEVVVTTKEETAVVESEKMETDDDKNEEALVENKNSEAVSTECAKLTEKEVENSEADPKISDDDKTEMVKNKTEETISDNGQKTEKNDTTEMEVDEIICDKETETKKNEETPVETKVEEETAKVEDCKQSDESTPKTSDTTTSPVETEKPVAIATENKIIAEPVKKEDAMDTQAETAEPEKKEVFSNCEKIEVENVSTDAATTVKSDSVTVTMETDKDNKDTDKISEVVDSADKIENETTAETITPKDLDISSKIAATGESQPIETPQAVESPPAVESQAIESQAVESQVVESETVKTADKTDSNEMETETSIEESNKDEKAKEDKDPHKVITLNDDKSEIDEKLAPEILAEKAEEKIIPENGNASKDEKDNEKISCPVEEPKDVTIITGKEEKEVEVAATTKTEKPSPKDGDNNHDTVVAAETNGKSAHDKSHNDSDKENDISESNGSTKDTPITEGVEKVQSSIEETQNGDLVMPVKKCKEIVPSPLPSAAEAAET